MPAQKMATIADEEFLALLAHELRNPLAPIMTAVHIIERQCANNPLVKSSTEILDRQINYLVRVINDILDIALLAKGELILQKKRIEICSLARKAVEDSKLTLNSRHHTIDVQTPMKDIWVMGDEVRLHQMLMHLLANAMKFTETGGKISLTINNGGDTVMVNVRDTGVGIPHHAMSKIFNLFPQPDHIRHPAQGGGMGIGLNLAYNLAELHGGTIEASGAGSGNEFSIILPVEEVTDPVIMVEISKVEKVTASRCLDVLVVDDHIDTAESLAILLKMWGHMVSICHNGNTAVQMAKASKPDVVVLDIGLPGYDGYQVAEKLKEEYNDILLIAVTGYGQKVDIRKSNNAGFQVHLVKPVMPDKLKEALDLLT